MELCLGAQHAHPPEPGHTPSEAALKFLNSSDPGLHVQASPPCPARVLPPLLAPRAGAALVLTGVSDLRGAHPSPHLRAPLHPWKVRARLPQMLLVWFGNLETNDLLVIKAATCPMLLISLREKKTGLSRPAPRCMMQCDALGEEYSSSDIVTTVYCSR